MSEPGPNEFRCAKCGNVYTKARPDDIAKAEAQAKFRPAPGDEYDVVCEPCYHAFLTWMSKNHPGVLRQ